MLKVTDTNQELTKVRLEKAMKRNHPVTVTYTKADGERTVRTIEIFEIKESKAGDFYVRAMDRKEGEARSFRIDRMHAITIHRTAFTVKRPTNFKEVIMAKDSGAPVAQEVSPRQAVVNEWRRVKKIVDACQDARAKASAQSHLSMALRPLRLASLMDESGGSYARACESARNSVALALRLVQV